MAGRLEQYDSFIEKSQYNVTQKKPKKVMNQQSKKQVKKELDQNKTSIVLQMSKKNKLICILFFKCNSHGKREYRMAVIPQKNKYHWDKRYLQIIDITSLTRKTILKTNLVKAKITKKKFGANQSSINFK